MNNGDLKKYYRIVGEGKPLLIINGGPGMSSEGFIPLAKQLSKYHQITFLKGYTIKYSTERTDSTITE